MNALISNPKWLRWIVALLAIGSENFSATTVAQSPGKYDKVDARIAATDLPPLLLQFATEGIRLPGADNFVLSPPIFSSPAGASDANSSPDLSADSTWSTEQILETLTTLAGRAGWERFSRDSAVSPVMIKTEAIDGDEGTRVGHHVQSAFIAYARLDQLRDETLMRAVFGDQQDKEEATFAQLAPEELKQLGIGADQTRQSVFARMELKLLNKIVIRGIVRMQRTESDDSIVLVWELCPEFSQASDSQAPTSAEPGDSSNTWTKLVPNNVGKLIESAPAAYSGCAGYLSVRATGLTDVQLLVESRLVMHEPADWFSGSNLLRSKLPTVMQESARNFRRQIQKLPR